MNLITTKTIAPGQPGSKKELDKYEDRLVCVRYRYDSEQEVRLKTVEIIVDSKRIAKNEDRIPFNKKVFVRIDYDEFALRKTVKSIGATWDSKKKLWEMRYGDAYNLGLEDRIVED